MEFFKWSLVAALVLGEVGRRAELLRPRVRRAVRHPPQLQPQLVVAEAPGVDFMNPFRTVIYGQDLFKSNLSRKLGSFIA
jgi:hypothetical protein